MTQGNTDQAFNCCFIHGREVGVGGALEKRGFAMCRLGMEKVLVLDWDVHHGNGIEEILYGRPDVMYISLHRWCALMRSYH